MFRTLGKQRGRIVAVADVGSGSVGVGIAEISSHGHARVLIAERAALPAGERSAEASIAGILALLETTAQKVLTAQSARAKAAKHVDAAYAVVHAPWARSKTIRAESRFPESVRIEQGMVATLAKEALRSEGALDAKNILEAGVIRVELNGYPTLQPFGKRASHIAASSLLSECDARVREGVATALARVFACPPPTVRSDTRALLSVTRECSALPKESLIVNMAHEATNVIVVRKGIVVETTLVPEGIRTIIARITGGKMPEETLTLIRLLMLDQCEAEACESIKTAIANAEPELVKAFGEAFSTLSAGRHLPNKLVLLTHQDLAPWLSRFFGRIDFAQFTVTTRPFVPTSVSVDAIRDLVTFDSPPDISLGIASALVPLEMGWR